MAQIHVETKPFHQFFETPRMAIEYHLMHVRETMKANNEYISTAFLFREKAVFICPATFTNEKEKAKYLKELKRIARARDCTHSIIIMDCWLRTVKTATADSVDYQTIRKTVEPVDAINIAYETKGFYTFRYWKVMRDQDNSFLDLEPLETDYEYENELYRAESAWLLFNDEKVGSIQ